MPFWYDMSLFECHMENKTYLIKRKYKYPRSTLHCSIRGHNYIINTMLTWSISEFGNTDTDFNVI